MKKLFLLALLLFKLIFCQGQTSGCYYSEDMEPIDSVTSFSTTGLGGFVSNTRLFTSSTKCDSASVIAGDVTTLTTHPIDVGPYTYLILQFNHICKVDFFDHAYVYVNSVLYGIHDQLTAQQFLDTTQNDYIYFQTQGNSFSEAAWGNDWLPGQVAIPINSWWRTERFNISMYGGIPDLQIEFRLEDGSNLGGNGRAGWFIDDICIQAAPCELFPPAVVPVNLLQGTAYSLGPYNTAWNISDISGIDTNSTWLHWTINGGSPDSVKLSYNQSAQLYFGEIPAVNDSDIVCYYVTATDNSFCHNIATYPIVGCTQFIATQGVGFPYCDDFDLLSSSWTDSNSISTPWQSGIPITGIPAAAFSPPHVWEVGLNAPYTASTDALLYSPHLDFSNAVNAKLSVWLNYDTESGWDGTRLEYSTDQGSSWNILGTINDLNGTNWYNVTANCNGVPSWTGQSNTVFGNINGWYKAEYELASAGLNNLPDVQFRFHFCSDAVIQTYGFAIDNFCITLPYPQDAGITQVLGPGAQGPSGVCLPIIVNINNFGTQAVLSTNVFYSLNGIIKGPYNWIGVLPPGQSISYTLPCDTIPIGLSSICAWTDLLNDGNHFNDSICASTFGFPVITPGSCNNFESGSPGWLSTPSIGTTSWQLGTPNYGATTGAHSGTNAWDINLNTSYATNAHDTLYTPIYNIGSVSNPYLSFWQNRNTTLTQDGFWVEYTINSGIIWQTLGDINSNTSGNAINWYNDASLNFTNLPDFGGNSTGWIKSTFFLQNILSGSPQYVQFRFVFLSNQFGVPADGVSIDDFCITLPPPIDAGLTYITSANNMQTQPAGQPDSLQVTIHNFGSTNINSANIYFRINGTGTIYGPYNWTGNLQPNGNSGPFVLTGLTYTIPAGNYSICAWTTLTGDGNQSNDTSCVNLFGVPVINISALNPYCDNFDFINNGWSNELQAGANPATNWELGIPAFGVTTGAYSPPNAWDINLTTAYTPSANVVLYSPYINIPPGSNPYLSFWHKWNTEQNWDGVRLEYSQNGGAWTTLGTIGDPNAFNWYTNNINCSGQPAWAGNSTTMAGNNNGWVFSKIRNLSFLSGNVQFRFYFCSDASVVVDGYTVDNFCIKVPPPIDAGISASSSYNGVNIPSGSSDSVVVSISNYGSSSISNIPVYFSVHGTTYGPYVYSPSIASGITVNSIVLSGFTYPIDTGENVICAWTNLTGDGDHSNDTTCSSSYGYITIAVDYLSPFYDNFDGTDYGYAPQLIQGGDPGTVWELGTPAFGATTGAYSPPNSWDINLSTGYNINAHAALYTPFFTIPINSSPSISFWQNRNTNQFNDGADLEYSEDGGITWLPIGTISGGNSTNWYNTNLFCGNTSFDAWTGTSGGWIQSIINNQSQLNGKTVQFRFAFCSTAFSTGDGFSIDDFNIQMPIPVNAGANDISIINSNPMVFPGQCYSFSSKIKNNGTQPLDSLIATLVVDGTIVSTDHLIFNTPVAYGAISLPFTFSNCWTATPGPHTACLITSSPNGGIDLLTTDDTICTAITTVNQIDLTTGSSYCNNFETASAFIPLNAITNLPGGSWEYGNPNKTSCMVGSYSGTHSWVTKLFQNYPANDQSALWSPLFELNTNASYNISFQTKFDTELFTDGGTFQYSTDYGNTWNVLGNITDPNWMNTFNVIAINPTPPPNIPGWTGNSCTWEPKQHLACFPSSTGNNSIGVLFRFVFMSDIFTGGAGMQIDDFCVQPDTALCTVGIVQNEMVYDVLLEQNVPNPFSKEAVINYAIPSSAKIKMEVTDVAGKIVSVPIDEIQTTGKHSIKLDVSRFSPGIYFYTLKWKEKSVTRKMIVVGK